MFGRIIYSGLNVVINGITLSGVQSVDASYGATSEHLLDLSSGYLGEYVSQNLVGNFSFTKLMVGVDPLLSLTGASGFNGHLQYLSNSFGFQSGFLNQYRVQATVGQIPRSSANITIYGNMGSGFDAGLPATNLPIFISYPGDIVVACDGSSTNRITSFSYEVNVTRKPLYKLNNQVPILVQSENVTEIVAVFELEVEDYETQSMFNLLCSPHITGLTITLNQHCNDSVMIQDFSLTGAQLFGEAARSDISNPLKFTLTYKQFVGKP